MRTVGIIGGGPSGMMAAITIKRADSDIKVVLFERKEKLGKKLLATGNGRCNFTNSDMAPKYYNGRDEGFIREVLKDFDYSDAISFFHSLGVEEAVKDGYVYPRSNQASTVLLALLVQLKHLKVEVITDCRIKEVEKASTGFKFISDKGAVYHFDRAILATGGRANSALGSDGSGYKLARSLGHTLVPVVPSLVQLVVKDNPLKKASGVRCRAKVYGVVGDEKKVSSEGELQITDYGISGILIFQISRYISYCLERGSTTYVVLDFVPEYDTESFMELLKKRKVEFGYLTWEEYLNGLFPIKLSMVLLKLSGIRSSDYVKEYDDTALYLLNRHIKHLKLPISDTKGFEMAQVCAGGVSTKEINEDTMESKICPGLYICGELMDVDGLCGGYNLHFAWASGYLAGIDCVL